MQNKNCKITKCPPAYAQGYFTCNIFDDMAELQNNFNVAKTEKKNGKKKNSSRRLRNRPV